ncbi:GMC family oxidoreductase [soil metagenome]
MPDMRKAIADPDICIIGTGAAGGVLAKELAEAGFKVVALEAGPHWVPERDFVSDEKAAQQLYWTDKRITGGEDPIELAGNVTGRGVGGSTVHYTMVALRMYEEDFRTRTVDGVGEDWPITYGDLEPYYEQVERELGISGPVRWPWGPRRRGRYPYREHPLNAVAEVFARGCERLGITWSPAPIATISAPKDDRPPCVYRGFCNFGCSTNAKSSTLVTYIPKAIQAGAEIRAGCMVSRINLDDRGRARSVNYFRSDGDGGYIEEEQRARVIIVSGYSIETPRLLLNSACERFPQGLANSSGQVGTHLMIHAANNVYGRMEEMVRPYKAPPCLALTQDFYATDPRNDYARGYSIECVGPFPIQFAKMAASGKGMWGERLRTFMQDYNHYAGWGLNGECLPHPFNTVTVVPEERDQYGLPIPRVTFRWGDNEKKLINAGVAKMREILEAAGAVDLFEVDDTAHLMGGCRMGDDPRTSVVDGWCRSWDVPNLFICDGSVFVTSSGVNPSLTIQAIAARTADYITTAAARREL